MTAEVEVLKKVEREGRAKQDRARVYRITPNTADAPQEQALSLGCLRAKTTEVLVYRCPLRT